MGEKKVLWPGWETVRLIGRGSFGAVYEIERDVFGHKERAALKVITIPQSESDIDELLNDGYAEESITTRFEDYLHDIVREYSLMADMKGCANIVYCDDVRYIQHDNGMGWDIYIKMELLTALPKALGKSVSDEQVVKIGTDLCSALAFCEKRNLLHRDIKPQNVFVASDGTYKLGDFGIAKTAERTTSGTKTGTYKYMAPEIYNNQPYGGKADIYSLGLVLYWLLNDRRTPFLPLPPVTPTSSEEDKARARRFRGEPIPAPVHGSEELKRIILKACAYDPNDRYQSADEMLRELNALGAPASASAAQPVADDSRFVETVEKDNATVGAWAVPAAAPQDACDDATESTVGAWSARAKPAEEGTTQAEERTVGVWDKPEVQKPESAPAPKNPKKKGWLAVVAAVVAVVAVLLFAALFLIHVWEPATCTEPQICKLCGKTGGSALGHDWTEATCTEPQTCKRCRETSGSALGHDWAEATSDSPQTCRRCGIQLGTPIMSDAPIVDISAGDLHTVGLRSDGSVVATGYNEYGQCDVSGWKDIVAVSAGYCFTVGLKSDGTVVAVGDNKYGQCDVSEWKDIVAISAGKVHTVGLKSDGTVVAVGSNSTRQCNVSDWNNIVAVSAGYEFTVGLKSNGKVIVVGFDDDNPYRQYGKYRSIIAVSAGRTHTIGLKSDGTVDAVGSSSWGEYNVSDWRNIAAVSAGYGLSIGLKSDGTVVAVGNNNHGQCNVSGWSDIIAVSAGKDHTVGLKSDGTVVAVGWDYYGQCDVSDW